MLATLLRRTASLALPVALLAAAPPLLSQSQDQAPLAPSSFLTLMGKSCAVRYISGSLDRAHHVLRRMEFVTSYFNEWSDVPVPIVGYVLTRDEWRRAELPTSYGVPLRSGPTAVFVPAAGDEGTVALWRRLLATDRLPMVPGVPLVGTAEQAATMALADVSLQVELARGFVQRARLLGREAWIGEVSAHVAALTVFDLLERDRVPEINATYRDLGVRLGGEAAYALQSFLPAFMARDDDTLDQWLWFQSQFQRAAVMIHDKDGKKSVKKLVQLSEQGRGQILAPDLLERYPDLQSWLLTTFAPAPASHQ